MNLVLTMAGKYTRFREFSSRVPKYLLPLSSRTMLYYVLEPLLKEGVFKNVYLVANKRDIAFRPQILDTLATFDIPADHIVFIEDTPGQLDTALEGLAHFKNRIKGPVVIHNVDTILYGRDFAHIKEMLANPSIDCVVDIFRSSNREYSYVLMRGENVSAIVEKRVISDSASSGCYCFTDMELALKYMTRALAKDKHYISESIEEMIQDNGIVRTSVIKEDQNTVVLGTPEEYLSSMINIRS